MANTQTFTGDGETTTFNFTFPFFGVNDIHASINNVEVTSTNFTVTPNATPDDADIQYTGGTITFATAPANGATITVWRHVELTRHIDYQPTLQPQSYQLNQDLNQCMEILKEQNETLSNVISLANIPTVADLLTELSVIRNRLDTFLTADDLTDINTAIAAIPDKATKDMDNITTTGKASISSMLMPDYSNPITVSTSPYTAPSAGKFIMICKDNALGEASISVNGVEVSYFKAGVAISHQHEVTVSTGDIITFQSVGQTITTTFYPLKYVS